MGELRTTLANEKDKASSSSQKSAEVESKLKSELQALKETVAGRQSINAQDK